jgi:Protein of unknown function (DUF1566)
MNKQGLIAGFALAAAMALSPYAIGASPVVGDKTTDGTVYAGVSPDTHKPLYTTPADAPGIYTYNEAKSYCSALEASGHHDWRVPAKDELNVLYKNRKQGVLKGTFNETGSNPAGWYWSSSQSNHYAWVQRFSDGNQFHNGYYEYTDSSLRCVR